jgi:hypothetical protein
LANTSTMPVAMVPEPTTPTRCTGRTLPDSPASLGDTVSGTTTDEPGPS